MTHDFLHSSSFHLQDLPTYTYVPGISPHPVSHSLGHAYGQPRPLASGSLQPGKLLFDSGFYWESHEAWEAEWIAQKHHSANADFIKGLIKLAACGVKCLEQNASGAQRHAVRACELFQKTEQKLSLPVSANVHRQLLDLARNLKDLIPLATAAQQQATRTGGVVLLGTLPALP